MSIDDQRASTSSSASSLSGAASEGRRRYEETDLRGEVRRPRFRLWRNRSAQIGGTVMIILLFAAVFGPLIAPYPPNKPNYVHQFEGPSRSHLLGTDEFGRDTLSRLLYGARIALAIGLIADGIAAVIGAALGLVSGYYGGWVDSIIMRFMDIMLAFPYLLLALIVVAVLGPSLQNAMIAIGIVYVPQFGRLVRGTVLSVRQQDYVSAATVMGASPVRVMLRHVLPNALVPIIVMATLTVGHAILEASGLSFLGLGAQPPTAGWGAMLYGGRNYMRSDIWLATITGIAILITVLGFNLLGDGLRDVLDPRLRSR
jgi:peptide/nickel transport system permease protein